MLVLSRKEDDKILFPNLGISVQILRIEGNKVRVGVDAPRDVKILRHELAGKIQPPPRNSHKQGSRKQALAQQDEHLQGAAQALAELYDLSGRDLDRKAEQLILDVFHHLKGIDEQLSQVQVATAQAAPAKAGASGYRSGTNAAKRPLRRALLVEDNLNESRLLASYLRTKQFEVAIAGNGQEALDYLENHQSPDVVLLDMQMPQMDGATTIRHLRADDRHQSLKVFAVSGGDPTDYGVNVGARGVDGWFPKPLDPEALVFRIAFDIDERSIPQLSAPQLGTTPLGIGN